MNAPEPQAAGRIRVRVNGEERDLAARASVALLVEDWTRGAPREGIAVAVNGEVVPRPQWQERKIRDGDDIEIVRAVQGG